MLWWIGAAVAVLLSVVCALTLGKQAASGERRVWEPSFLVWAIGWHGIVGFGALVMVSQAIR